MEATADAPPRPEFLALGGFYKTDLEPWLAAHEGRRQKARLLRFVIIGGGFAALAAWLYIVLTRDWSEFWFFVMFVLGMVIIVVGNIPIFRLQSDVKKFVMEKLASFFNFTYMAKPDFADVRLFHDLGLLPMHDAQNFEDGLEGAIKGVPFKMVEAHLTKRHKSGKETKNVTVFRGLLLSLPYGTRNKDAASVWRRALNTWMSGDDLREVTVGEPSFDRSYIVHCIDDETARRLLDRDARAAFAAFDQREAVSDARLGIAEGRLLLVFNTGSDSFEAGRMSRPLADPNRVQDMVELFALPFDAVDGFKLQPAASGAAAGGGA